MVDSLQDIIARFRRAGRGPRRCLSVFMSAHRDDIAFSASTFADALRPGLVINLFTRSNYTDPAWARASSATAQDVTAMRAAEDAAYFAAAGLESVDLDADDTSLRNRAWNDPAGLDEDIAQIAKPLSTILSELESQFRLRVFAPAAIGGHVNHLAVRAVVWNWYAASPSTRQVAFYEDLPYARRRHFRTKGIAALKALVSPSSLKRSFRLVGGRKLGYVNAYPSQLRAPLTDLRTFSPATYWPPLAHEAIWTVT